MISVRQKGDFKNTEQFLKKAYGRNYFKVLEKYAQMGVDALSAATPIDTSLTSKSWYYELIETDRGLTINWANTNMAKGWFNVALMLQFGHGTRNGGWVEGIDYINPALKPIFDKMAEDAWREVVR